jgi:DNA-binding response OmpR family regulator
MKSDAHIIPSPFPTNGVKGQPASARGQTARKVILVIDDDPLFRKATVMKLRAHDYEVVSAEDGAAALTAVGTCKPDLILLDIHFPPDVAHGGGVAWDGFLILRFMRRKLEPGDVPVIAITGGDPNLYRKHCQDAGIVDLLAKPLDYELLVTRIRVLLNQRETETKAPAPPPPPPSNFQPDHRILFVDDDSSWHQMAIENLRQQGYEVVATNTAPGALSEAARIRPDLMILDLKLEKETGVSVMLLLLAAHPSVPLLVYAGLGVSPDDRNKLMQLGVFQIMQKRSMEELLTAVGLASQQPRRSVEEAPPAKPESTPSEAKARFDTILIVEDDPQFSELLRNYLESQSFYVTCVPDATEALRQMASTDFHVILTDMVLPKHSGEEFYNEVKRLRPELCRRFIFMTGHQAERRTDHFIRQSQALMLWKPFPLPDLLSTAQTVRRKDQLARALPHAQPVTVG